MQYAAALADTGHFGRAAERCHVTQPGLSQQIRQLEALCGAPLFDRLGKSVRLTPLGREFVERARPILEQSEGLLSFVAGQRATRPGRCGSASSQRWRPTFCRTSFRRCNATCRG